MQKEVSSKIHVFLDESGAFGFNFNSSGCASYFIIAAILVDEKDLSELLIQVEDIRKKYFQQGEIKSKNCNPKRRKLILFKLLELPFSVAYFVVDKRQIFEESNLRKYKKTFYKFLYQFFYHQLVSKIANISIHSDEIGCSDDLAEFKRYYYKQNESYQLFNELDFAFDNSKESLMVQVADFFAGTAALCYEQKNNGIDYLSIFKKRILFIKKFPQTKDDFLNETQFKTDDDKEIARLAIKLADDFVLNNASSNDIDIKQQSAIIDYLRFRFIQNQFRTYIPTKELINYLRNLGYEQMSSQQFRMKIIAKIRDNGVIIASSPNGYKLPASIAEVCDFINHGRNVILPMLSRLKICNETIRVATNNKINLFDKVEYKDLAQILDIQLPE